jgi:hypothetical protein
VALPPRVLAERSGHHAESRHQRELQAHHRQPGEAQRDREVRPEVVIG